MKKPWRKGPSISDVVATVYCERKSVLDRKFGQKRTAKVQMRALGGSMEHKRFEWQGNVRSAIDRRCYVATHLYGTDAPQTWALRQWRDTVLLPSVGGRLFVRVYYRVSPMVVSVMDRCPFIGYWLAVATRYAIDRIWFSGDRHV